MKFPDLLNGHGLPDCIELEMPGEDHDEANNGADENDINDIHKPKPVPDTHTYVVS